MAGRVRQMSIVLLHKTYYVKWSNPNLFWPQYESGTSPDSSTEYITLSKKIFPSNFMEMFLERKEIITA